MKKSIIAIINLIGLSWAAAQIPVECDLPEVFAAEAQWQTITSGHAGCEGAQWIGDTLYYAAHHDNLAFQWSLKSGLVIWRKDSPEATSFRPDGKGGFYVVEQTTRQLTRWNTQGQRLEVLASHFEGKRLNRPNDCVVHPDGSVWFTDPDWLFNNSRPNDIKELDGQYVFRFDAKTNKLTKASKGWLKPNGIAFSTDGSQLYITDSETAHVYVTPVNADGTLGERKVFATFEERGLDGLLYDRAGRLWCCTQNGVRIIGPSGQPLGLLKTPGKPTSLSFGAKGQMGVTTFRSESFKTSRLKSSPFFLPRLTHDDRAHLFSECRRGRAAPGRRRAPAHA
jgi:gluconolactonase